MNLYGVLETGLIVVIGAVSAYQVIKLLMPRLLQGARASLAKRLNRGGQGSWRDRLAATVRGAEPSGSCGSGCGGGCNSCRLATRVHPPLSSDDNSSH
jgi:hypothetical protein